MKRAFFAIMGFVVLGVLFVGCPNDTTDNTGIPLGLSGTFERTQSADGSSKPAIYEMTFTGTAQRNGNCDIIFGGYTGNYQVENGTTAVAYATYIEGQIKELPNFTITRNENVITMTAQNNDMKNNNQTGGQKYFSISFK